MLPEDQFKSFNWMLWTYYPQYFSSYSMDRVDVVDKLLECFSHEVSIQITKTVLAKMSKNKEVAHLQNMCTRSKCISSLKIALIINLYTKILNGKFTTCFFSSL